MLTILSDILTFSVVSVAENGRYKDWYMGL